MDDGELAELMSLHPKIMHRPLLTDGHRLVVGFDRESMEGLISEQMAPDSGLS